ncbi:SMI1/KNR4 family protein [Streptomyces sp. NPDC001941]|uniref:SMI1/KNR4 family protein n=1 Tax=Streptomyces sp. NPDC001941 TaxID=3154659 RepID=UPI00331C9158
MKTFQWGPLLERWSEEWLEGLAKAEPEEFEELDEVVRRERWMGFAPAGAEQLAALEERVRGLGVEVPLPPSLLAFLAVSNGWRYTGGSFYLMAGAEGIDAYGDPYGLQEVYEEGLGDGATPEEVREAGMWGRALQLVLDSDMTDVLLDPGDVGGDGEWAVYVYRGWSGEAPARHASFREFMEQEYLHFYAMRGSDPEFETSVTREQDAAVERARAACLRGELDAALAVFEEAEELGRPRAHFLAAQLRSFLGVVRTVAVEPLMDDPFYAHEVLPPRVVEHLRTRRADDFFLGPDTEENARERRRVAAVVERVAGRTHAYTAPGAFGDAVVTARELARWGDTEGAWRVLLAAVPLWEPYHEDHVAPLGLLGDPLLGPVITPERGRELLLTARAGQPGTGERQSTAPESIPSAAADTAGEPVRDGLGWLADSVPDGLNSRDPYRFVLVAGVGPEELAGRFGTGPLEAVANEHEVWRLRFVQGQARAERAVRVGARDGWSFAFESSPVTLFDADRLVAPGTALSAGTRALTVWRAEDAFHFAYAEDGEQRYAFTVTGTGWQRVGELPDALDPARLFPGAGGAGEAGADGAVEAGADGADRLGEEGGSGEERFVVDAAGERAALEAVAAEFGVSLPRFALDRGRLPVVSTKPWLRPYGSGESYATISFGSSRPGQTGAEYPGAERTGAE